MFGKIKLRKDDIEFSKYLRKKRGYMCEFCYRKYPDGNGLQISHFHGRRRESVRINEENCSVLCAGCHRKMHENPALYAEWKFKQLGQTRYDLLRLKANQYQKKNITSNLKDIQFRILSMEQEKPHNRRSL